MSCSFCNSKNPQFRKAGTKLLFCNQECYIGKRSREDEFQISSSDGAVLGIDSSKVLFDASETIRYLAEDTNDKILKLPIRACILLHIYKCLSSDPSTNDHLLSYSMQEKVEMVLACNYLIINGLWLRCMNATIGNFFEKHFDYVYQARIFFDLPDDGAFTKKITDETEITIGILKRYERYANGIESDKPSIINITNDQILKYLNRRHTAGEGLSGAYLDIMRKTHVRFFTVISQFMLDKKIKVVLRYVQNEKFLEYEEDLPGFKNLQILYTYQVSVNFKIDLNIVRQLIKKAILDKDYTTLYKITDAKTFEKILSGKYIMHELLNSKQKFLY